MADTDTPKPEAPKGKPRGGKGGNREGGGKGGGREGGKGGKPRKPRAEIPTFEDPVAKLKEVEAGGEPSRPNRDHLETKIQRVQNEIDTSKRRTEAITKELDAIKEKNEKLKAHGSGPLEKCREKLRELKKQIVGVIEERKRVSASIDKIREQKQGMDEAIKKQRGEIGRFSSNEAIDDEIRRIEDYMAHNSIDLKTEKSLMIDIKELNKKRDAVKHLEVMEGKRGAGGAQMSLPELFEARKVVDGKLDVLRSEEKVAVEEMNGLREKHQNKESSERFEKLLAERQEIRTKISEKIGQIREMRSEHNEQDDKWYEYDRLVKNLKWQCREINKKEREENQKQWEEDKAKRDEEWAKEKEHRKNFDEDGNPREKFMDFDMGERLGQCEQLITFLKKYMPQEEAEVADTKVQDGRKVADAPADAKEFVKPLESGLADDPLGLNAFMVEEVTSKRSKKKEKKKKKNAEKNDDLTIVASGESVNLQLSLSMIQQFASMSLPVPINSDDCAGSVAQLEEKLAYYNEKAAAGMSLKDLVKEEKAAKKGGGKKEDKPAKKAEKKESKTATSQLGEVKELSLEEMRAAAQGNKLTEEEKKARGLLYDTSIASAVRDESEDDDEEDEEANFMGGDPFEGL